MNYLRKEIHSIDMANALFKFDRIFLTKDDYPILKDISLNVHAGDFITFLGPSGSGKSSLLRLFNGLDSPTSGTIKYDGKFLNDYDPRDLRKRVGMVFQKPVMVQGTVKDNLLLTQRWEKEKSLISGNDLINTLKSVGLSDFFLDKDANSLSGGEQQRVALARVLLNEPKVLLLDEPTANLDPQLAQRILKIVSNLHKDLSLTVILVSHNYHLVKKFAGKVAFLINGEIVEEGAVAILDSPSTATARRFLAEEIV